MSYPLHKKIADIIQSKLSNKRLDYNIIKSPECGGNQKIPLYLTDDSEICEVDLVILKDNRIKVIIEIEESDITPVHICGKILASSLSSYYFYKSKGEGPIKMDDSVLFIQILDTSSLPSGTSKDNQFKSLDKSIQNIVPIKDGKIDNYKIFFGDIDYFEKEDNKENFLKYIINFLKDNNK